MNEERELLERWVSQFGNLRHDFNLLTETKELLAQPVKYQFTTSLDQEPVMYQYRDKLDGKDWGRWNLCNKIDYEDYKNNPTFQHWTYQTRKLLAQPEQEPSVKLPDSEDEAVMMNLLSDNWLRNHAPHRLNQPEQEPVAWMQDSIELYVLEEKSAIRGYVIPLYTAPPKREPLSDEAVSELLMGGFSTHLMDLVRMIEKAHGIGSGE